MRAYRLTFHLRGLFLTPWQADTLFGHLCWALRWRDGPAAVAALLARCEAGDPPILLSNGFPGDWLPCPVWPRLPDREADPAELRDRILAREKAGRREWLTLEQLNAWRLHPGQIPDGAAGPRPAAAARVLFKNRINRLTGTTAAQAKDDAEGSLFAVEERFLAARRPPDPGEPIDRVSVYARIADDWLDTAGALLQRVAQTGYGRKKSSGYGQFDFDPETGLAPFDGFSPVDGANGFVSLSNWAPAGDDPVDGYYQTMVKYGRLGEVYAVEGEARPPFKQPLVMLKAGSCFRVDRPKPFYGRLVRNVHRGDDQIVQYGLAFDLPVRFS